MSGSALRTTASGTTGVIASGVPSASAASNAAVPADCPSSAKRSIW